MHPAFLNTALCEMLGIRYPIMSAGMNDCAGPELVAAVSNAGGLGSLGTGRADADYMRQEIRKVKALTDRPFAVQFPAKPLVHPHEADLPQEHLDFIDGLRTEFNVPAPIACRHLKTNGGALLPRRSRTRRSCRSFSKKRFRCW
jgi:NAD(P)H-dependent flavin oxidoreductase YrpB (nitropropane dioxygenase family)